MSADTFSFLLLWKSVSALSLLDRLFWRIKSISR